MGRYLWLWRVLSLVVGDDSSGRCVSCTHAEPPPRQTCRRLSPTTVVSIQKEGTTTRKPPSTSKQATTSAMFGRHPVAIEIHAIAVAQHLNVPFTTQPSPSPSSPPSRTIRETFILRAHVHEAHLFCCWYWSRHRFSRGAHATTVRASSASRSVKRSKGCPSHTAVAKGTIELAAIVASCRSHTRGGKDNNVTNVIPSSRCQGGIVAVVATNSTPRPLWRFQ